MRQVDIKFLEEQVKLALRNQKNPQQLNEAAQLGAIATGIGIALIAGPFAWRLAIRDYFTHKKQEFAQNGGSNMPGWVPWVDMVSDFFIGSWDYSYKALQGSISQATKYGISPGGYISAAMDAQKEMDPYSKTLFRFVDAKPPISNTGVSQLGAIMWKEDVFDGLRKRISKHAKKIQKEIPRNDQEATKYLIEQFMDDTFDFLDKKGISDRKGSLRNNLYTFGLDDNESAVDRDTKVMFRPDEKWCAQEAKSILRKAKNNQFKSDTDLRIHMEEMILNTNHFFFKKGFQSFEELRCQEVNQKTLINISVLAVHAKTVEQSSDWVIVGLAVADIVFSLISTVMFFMGGWALKGGQLILKIAAREYAKSYARYLFGQIMLARVQKLAEVVNSQKKLTKFVRFGTVAAATALEVGLDMDRSYDLKLKKLEVYNKAYFQIAIENKFDPSDFGIVDLQDMTIAGRFIWNQISGLYNSIFNAEEQEASQLSQLAQAEEEESQELAAIDFTTLKNGSKRKEEFLNRLLYGTNKKKNIFSGTARTDGILETYRDLLNLQFKHMHNHAKAINQALNAPEADIPMPPEKDNKGIRTSIKEIEMSYLSLDEEMCTSYYESLLDYQEAIELANEELKKISKNASLIGPAYVDIKEKQTKQLQKIAKNAKIALSSDCKAPEAVYQQDATPAVDEPESTQLAAPAAVPAAATADATSETPTLVELDPIDVIIIGDSNANGMLGYFKGNTNRTKHVIRSGFSAAAILKLLKAHFKKNYPSLNEQTTKKRVPKAAIIHMGYNGPSKNLQAMKDTVVFLQEKGIKDIRIVDIKVTGNKYASPAGERAYIKNIKTLSDELNKFPSQYPGVTIIPNNGIVKTKKMGGDGFHFTDAGYQQIVKDSLKGIQIKYIDPKPEQTKVGTTLNLASARSIQEDIKKEFGVTLTPEQEAAVEKIYSHAISKISFINNKREFDSWRHAVGQFESGNRYLGPKSGTYIGRYGIGPQSWIEARAKIRNIDKSLLPFMPAYGIPYKGPKKPYFIDGTWTSIAAVNKDPVAQEIFWLGHCLNKLAGLQGQTTNAAHGIGLTGIGHNIGSSMAVKWENLRKQYEKTQDDMFLYRMWALQDGYGTPGENFHRKLSRTLGGSPRKMPQGFMWSNKFRRPGFKNLPAGGDRKLLEQMKQFDSAFYEYVRDYASKRVYSQRIEAFDKKDMAKRLWMWCTQSGKNFYAKDKRNQGFSADISQYYDSKGYPKGAFTAGSVTPDSGVGGGITAPVADTAKKTTKTAAKTAEPKAVKKAEKNLSDLLKTGMVMSAKDAEKKFQQRVERISAAKNFFDLTVETNILYGVEKLDVSANADRAKEYLEKSRTGDLKPFTSVKFNELKKRTHSRNRSKFFTLYNDIKAENQQKANELMAYLHRPRILVYLDVDRLLYTNKSTYSLSFELGPPYAGRVGIINRQHSFFSRRSFGETPEKANLIRILKINQDTFEALHDKLEGFGVGEIESAGLTLKDKERYLSFYKTFINLLSDAVEALTDTGPMLRKAIALENLAAAVYLLG